MSVSQNRLRQHAKQISPVEQRFYDKNDEIVARIRGLLDERDLTQKELAKKLGKTPSYVSRVLGGAVNLTLQTITEFEVALEADIISVPSPESRSPTTGMTSKTKREFAVGSE